MRDKMNSFYDLFKMIKEKRIRKWDVLELIGEENEKDYYIITDKDIRWLRDKDVYFWDNFFLFELLEKWKFNVVYKDNEKKEILERFGLNLEDVKGW